MQSNDIGAWAMFFRPFMLLILAVAILYPARMLLQRYMKDGWLKRLLLRRIN
jgi:hypothetical protein